MTQLTISARISPMINAKLEKLAEATNRTKSYLAAEAIERYIDDQAWQIEAIQQGVIEAEAGKFASDQDIDDFMKKWNLNAR